ncbi:MAG: AAA family ATPase [Candidatus Aenigmatarchaeota archaeon]
MKIPLLIEVIGETGVGKTHFCFTFPDVFLIDTSPKAEAFAIAHKLGMENRYYLALDYIDVVTKIDELVKREDVLTIAIDTGANLQGMASIHYLKEMEKKGKKREKVLPIEYGVIRDMVDFNIIRKVISANKNLVITSRMKDEYIGGEKTGRRERDGYPRLPDMADIRVYIELVEDKTFNRIDRVIHVVKNRFVDRASQNWIEKLDRNDAEGIFNLVVRSGIKEEYLVWKK